MAYRAEILSNGARQSASNEYTHIHNFVNEIDRLTRSLSLTPFGGFLDSTDWEIQTVCGREAEDAAEYEAEHEKWMSAGDALHTIESLIDHLRISNVRFGLIVNKNLEVLAELQEIHTWLKTGAQPDDSFHLALVF